MKKYFALILTLIASIPAIAQAVAAPPEMAEGLYASGKIYVVLTVVLVILAGIFIYLIMIDRKVNALEKRSPGTTK